MTPDSGNDASAGDYLKSLPLYALPHHFLSRLVLLATRIRFGPWKRGLIRWFVHHYSVDLSDAAKSSPDQFRNFNKFFTRALHPDARPIDTAPGVVCSPVDGAVSQSGAIRQGRIFQAKGRDYSLVELLGGGPERAAQFDNGSFATLYLSPRDYHRIHMPYDGWLLQTVYVPGRLFSVAPHTTRTIPRLFSRNERLVAIFNTDAGPMAVILVGAIFVACIETVWAGIATPPHRHKTLVRNYTANTDTMIHLETGDELGRFNMGSTVILLFGPDRITWSDALVPGGSVRMGQAIGQRTDTGRQPS